MFHGDEYPKISPDQLGEFFAGDGHRRLHVENMGTLEIRGGAHAGRLLMAHGAGAGQHSAFMQNFCESLAQEGVQTLAFEFRYMQRMQRESRRFPPPKIDRLVEETAQWRDIVMHPAFPDVYMGGKSMGGRAASLLAARDGAQGLVLCGYPFHPPGKPDATRLSHWPLLQCPTLVMQGTRDPFGNRQEVAGYDLPRSVTVHFLEDGDHDWKPRKSAGLTQEALIKEAAVGVAAWMRASR
ncbi:alpha/beta family hydrolase [Halomonas sp. WWR20]